MIHRPPDWTPRTWHSGLRPGRGNPWGPLAVHFLYVKERWSGAGRVVMLIHVADLQFDMPFVSLGVDDLQSFLIDYTALIFVNRGLINGLVSGWVVANWWFEARFLCHFMLGSSQSQGIVWTCLNIISHDGLNTQHGHEALHQWVAMGSISQGLGLDGQGSPGWFFRGAWRFLKIGAPQSYAWFVTTNGS